MSFFDPKRAVGGLIDTVLSPNDRDFIDDVSGILDGDISIKSVNDIMDYLSNPGGHSREFDYDWLVDYFKSKSGGQFGQIGSVLTKMGIDTSTLSQFDQAIGFAQSSLDKVSNLGFGVGDYVSKVRNQAMNSLGSFGETIASKLRDWGPVGELFTYAGILNTPGDPLALDMRQLLTELAEDHGIIMSRKRSEAVARKFHFISKPYLESDSMGMYHTKVFFTRPNLNLVILGDDGRYYPHPQLYRYKELSSLVETNIELAAELCRDNCKKSNLFPLLSNYCKEVPPIRLNESDRNGVQNKYGFSMPVKSISNDVGIDIPVTFTDNARGDISFLFYLMDIYTRAVTNQGYSKRPEYIKYNMIDTAMSFYMVTTDSNYNIISFSTAIGLHINDTVTHFARHSEDGLSKEEILGEFSVSFKCFDFSAHNPSYYDAFNRISGFDPSRVIDTKGSSRTLIRMPYNNAERKSIVEDKSMTGKRIPHRTSLFDPNYGGYQSTKDSSTGKIETAKDSFLNLRSLGEMAVNKVSEFATSLGFLKEPSKETQNVDRSSVHFGYYIPYPDVFEHLGRFPGVYAAVKSEEERYSGIPSFEANTSGVTSKPLVYKLGWSR